MATINDNIDKIDKSAFVVMDRTKKKVQLEPLKGIRVNKNAKINKIEKVEDRIYKCVCCGKEYQTQKGNFYYSNSVLYEGNNNFVPFCKNCIDKYYNQLIGFYSGNKAHALDRICQLFDWYYDNDSAENSINNDKGFEPLSLYPQRINTNAVKKKGLIYLDTIKDRNSNFILEDNDLENNFTVDVNGEVELEKSIPKEVVTFFGYGYKLEEYLYLQEQYLDWKSRYECKTKAQEELFKAISIMQLTIQRAQKEGNTKSAIDAMKAFQDLLGTANLKPNQNSNNGLADQNTAGTLIKLRELERPIEEPQEKYKDVDNIIKYINTFYTGHMCKLAHLENDMAESYEKEMAKYTVYPPTYNGEEEVDTSILDKYSDKKTENKGEDDET